MIRSGPSAQSSVIMMGLVVVGAAIIAVTALDLAAPVREPPAAAQFGFEGSPADGPRPVDAERDLVRATYVAGDRIGARDVRVTVVVADRRVVLDGAEARPHALSAGERVSIRFVDGRVVARWGTPDGPPTWSRTLDRPVDVEPGDRVRFLVAMRGSELSIADLETTA